MHAPDQVLSTLLSGLDRMHIFLGSLVLLFATAALAYAPGALILLLLKPSLSPAEHITLSCVIGLVVSAAVYWLFGFGHLFHLYFLWPLLATVAFAALLWSRGRFHGRRPAAELPSHERVVTYHHDGSWLAFVGIVALGITVLAILPQYYTNLIPRNDGTMKVYPLGDVFLHLAIANELTHTIPPQTPVFAGHALTLTLRFVPTLFLALSILCVSLLLTRLARFGILRRPCRVSGLFRRRLCLCSRPATGRKGHGICSYRLSSSLSGPRTCSKSRH